MNRIPSVVTGLLCATVVAGLPARGAEEGAAPRPIVITVDDLPIASGKLHSTPADREAITRGLLAALAKHKVPALGLVTWQNVRSDADLKLLALWLEAGHELGNHSASHLNYTATPAKEYIADIEAGRSALADWLGKRGRKVEYFRFPFLCEGNTPEKLVAMREYLAKSGQRNMPVTIDDQDWSYEEPWSVALAAPDTPGRKAQLDQVAEEYHEALHAAVRHQEELGDALFGRTTPQILLLHANSVGAAQWDALFTWLEQTGHRFAPVAEVLADPALQETHAYVGDYGVGLWQRIRDGRRRDDAQAAVRKLLDAQIAAWNRGDVDAFVSGYAPDATFLAPDGVTRGRDAVLARYKERYKDRAAMGRLSLEILEMRPAAGTEFSIYGDAVPGRVQGMSVAARWSIAREGAEGVSGLTLIVLRRRGEGWEIVQDASM
jgi:peptidoglycan/xylan/chitin deacetylase (PgdA/CDA1 family)